MKMYVYDILSIVVIGICHVLLYFQLIRYERASYTFIITISIVFTILLSIVVTTTGYPEWNIVLLLLFLLCLGLMKEGLPFHQNLYYSLVSMVVITLTKIVLLELTWWVFIISPFALYLWTISVLNFIVSVIIFLSLLLCRKWISQLAEFITETHFYYVSYGILVVGLFIGLILTTPSAKPLVELHIQYGEIGYTLAFILFFILLLIILVVFHLSKNRLIMEQEKTMHEQLMDYVEKLEWMHGELASFRHDYMNILLSLDEGIRTKNFSQVEQIYKEVIAPTSQWMNGRELELTKLANVQIPEVKSVLSVKMIAAQQQQIHVFVDIPKPIHSIAMPLIPFIRAISVLIDNAIEEAVLSEEKRVKLAFFELEDAQYFIVQNSCQANHIDIAEIFKKGYSRKKGNRGYGLFSLKRIIDETPHATLETEFTPPDFSQTLILKKNVTNYEGKPTK